MPTPTYRLEGWSVVPSLRLKGHVYGRTGELPSEPGRPVIDGDELLTGPVVAVRERVVTTASGSRYLLGVPSRDFAALDEGSLDERFHRMGVPT